MEKRTKNRLNRKDGYEHVKTSKSRPARSPRAGYQPPEGDKKLKTPTTETNVTTDKK